jgi:hypothetical protein
VNCADTVTYSGTWKFEDRRISGGDDLYTEATKRSAKVAFISDGEVRDDRPVAAKSTTDADRLFIGSVDNGAHRGVARIG